MSKRYTKKQNFFHLTSIIGLVIAIWCCQLVAKPANKQNHHGKNSVQAEDSNSISQAFSKLTSGSVPGINAPGLDPHVLRLAVKAYNKAKAMGINTKEYLTVVDYSMPSSKRRMWVIDMKKNKVLHHTHVAHGTATGDDYARRFSNRPGSHMSSLGTFVTGKIYNGRFGKSLELHGLEDKFNSNAYARRIVVHAAHYVDEHVINKIGRLGRSFGCLALNKRIAGEVMQLIKDGSLIFCYYPDTNWLYSSKILNS